MKILFIGPQGSGKSTQARLLAQHLNVPFISFGDLLRVLASKDNVEGRELKSDMASGKLVDDNIAALVMEQRVSQDDCKLGFVSDGYARSLHQLSLFDPQFDLVIHLDISDAEVIDRLLKRADVEKRFDDTREAIKTRLSSYHQFTEPVLDRYRNEGILHTVSGIGEVSLIQKNIRDVVEKKGMG